MEELSKTDLSAESCIHATNALLKLYIRKSSRKEYLDSVMELIHDWSNCHCVGIRVLNTYGNIPFESYVGYSKKFWDSENWLSIQEDQCACIRVIQGKPELQDLPAITPGGSFRLNNANEFFSALPEEEKGRFRDVCLQSGFKSIAIIPIRYQESVIGAIHVADEKEGMVPLKTVEFIESISPLIGEAVHRFSTEEELVKYQQHLEELVEERTAMLRAATEKLQQEIAERKIAAEGLETRVKERTSELEKANIELRRLSAHLQSVREQERTNIARDIHDELGQVLTALKIEVSMFANKLHPDDKFPDKTESIIKKIDDTIQSVKRICAELRPTILDHFGLSAAIEWHIEEFENRTGIKCNVSLEPREIILDQDLTTSVFRIFQEALTNVVRHADASEVRVTLRLKDGKIMLEIKDNGKGITKKHFLDSQSFGIMGIRERVNFFGGNVKITGIKDKGTTIMVSIPLKKKEVP
jgi:signal transduction histidine kinase